LELLALHKKEEEGDAIAFFFFFSCNTKKKQMLFVELHCNAAYLVQRNSTNKQTK
jgi:hypothetical protein